MDIYVDMDIILMWISGCGGKCGYCVWLCIQSVALYVNVDKCGYVH